MDARWLPVMPAALGALALSLVSGCREGSRPGADLAQPARYQLSAPPSRRVALPDELHEISGLAVSPDGRVFAHGDEEGTVFQIDPADGHIVRRFALEPTGPEVDLGKKGRRGRVTGDFEDIAIVGDRFFLVTSNGVLLEFSEGADGASVPYRATVTGLADRCEVEGLAHDSAAGALLLLCKQLHSKADRGAVEIYAWSLANRTLAAQPRIAIPEATLQRVLGAQRFNGSALAFMRGGQSLLLIAGPQRLFLQVGLDGRVGGGGALDRAALTQPEGVAFLRDGTLLVSSEGGKGAASLNAYAAR